MSNICGAQEKLLSHRRLTLNPRCLQWNGTSFEVFPSPRPNDLIVPQVFSLVTIVSYQRTVYIFIYILRGFSNVSFAVKKISTYVGLKLCIGATVEVRISYL